MHKLWDKYGLQNVFLQEGGYFVFKFAKPKDRENVLALGPRYISNKQLCLKQWKGGMDFHFNSCTKAPVWVKFHNIPMSYWSFTGLSYLASRVGVPLLVDKITEKLEPMNFARICVEITPSSILPSSLDVVVLDKETNSEKVVTVEVEYQNRPQICSHYKWLPKVQKPSDSSIVTASVVPLSTPVIPKSITAPAATSKNWTLVTKGPKQNVPFSDPPLVGDSNSFLPIAAAGGVIEGPSDTDCSPSPNPLVGKLKMIDAKAGRDLKAKARASLELGQSSKKKIKGGGRPAPT